MVYPYTQENKKLKLENSAVRDEIKLLNEKQKQLLMELEHYQRVSSVTDFSYWLTKTMTTSVTTPTMTTRRKASRSN